MAVVHVEVRDRVGILALDDPQRRNCLSAEMLQGLTAGLVELAEAEVRVVVLRAAPGSPVWSAGLDVHSLPQPGRDPLDYQDPLEHVIRQVGHFPAPVIAMVDGGVWGGACDLAFVCDLAIGCETATFAITPAKLGVPYNCSGKLPLPQPGGPEGGPGDVLHGRAHPRLLGRGGGDPEPPGAEGRAGGLHHEDGEPDRRELPARGRSDQGAAPHPRPQPPGSPDTFERIQALRRCVFESADYVEGKKAFLEKRKPTFTGEGEPLAACKVPEGTA